LVVGGALLPTEIHADDAEEGFTAIFDGKTLQDWDGDRRFWRVDDGSITGETTKQKPLKRNTFLIWRGGTVGDFELKLEYRIVGGNSGIQYRGWQEPEERGKWVVSGYQADIDSTKQPRWCGALYEENRRGFLARRGQKIVVGEDNEPRLVGTTGDHAELYSGIKFEDWNTYHIIAKGYHFIHKINGRVMIEATDEDTRARRAKGLLALQLHSGDPMKLQIRRVRLKRTDG
jgi:hypothetical protein